MTQLEMGALLTLILWSAVIVWKAAHMHLAVRTLRQDHDSLDVRTERLRASFGNHCADGDIHCNPRAETDFRQEMRERMREFSERLGTIEGHLLAIKRNGRQS